MFFLNDNLTSVLLAGPAVVPVLPLAKFNFDILVLSEGATLHSIAFSDASRYDAKKNDDEIRLIGSWDLGVLFQKVLPAGHNTGRVIIKFLDESLIIFYKKFHKLSIPKMAHPSRNFAIIFKHSQNFQKIFKKPN